MFRPSCGAPISTAARRGTAALIMLVTAAMSASAQAVGTISVGATVGGSIDGGTQEYQGRRTAFYYFNCTSGQALQLNVNSAFDNVALITDMGGRQLAFNDDANETLNAQIDWVCPASATYRAGAAPLSMQASGPFTLSLQFAGMAAPQPAVVGYISIGATVGGTIDAGTPQYNGRRTAFYNFQCGGGQAVRVNVNSAFDNVAFITDQNGNQLAYNDDANGSLNAQIDWVCPAGGTYRAGAGALGTQSSGPFTLSLQAGGMAPQPQPLVAGYISVGATVGGTIDAGTPHVDGRPTVLYNFQCASGQSLRLNVTSAFDNVAMITDGSGNQLAFNDDANGSLNAQVDWVCPSSGTYRAGAGALSSQGSGPFTMTLQSNGMITPQPVVAGWISMGATVGGYINAGTPMFQGRPTVFYNFNCTGGQSVRLNVNSSFDNVAFIADQNGNQLAYNDDANGSLNAQINWVCPAGGTYRAGAGSLRQGVDGSFTLSLSY